tara:strand:+ start:4920 stop:5267 length:348 start_codon:yes stop_codon:yes gene_type:complete
MTTCAECNHTFDPDDPRACIDKREVTAEMDFPKQDPLCPLCAYQMIGGLEAWAVANDCNGIFGDTIRRTRSEVEALLQPGPQSYGGVGCEAIPVRVYRERQDRIEIRAFNEGERV